MPRTMHFRRSASYNMALEKPTSSQLPSSPDDGRGAGKVTRKKAKLVKDFGSFSRTSVSSSSTTEEDHDHVCVVTLSSSSNGLSSSSRKRPKKKKAAVVSSKGAKPQIVKLSQSVVRYSQSVQPSVTVRSAQGGRNKSQSPQRSRSRSRNRKQKKKVIGLPKGLFHCVGGGARSRSCTPERNIGLRVNLTEQEKENMNILLSSLKGHVHNVNYLEEEFVRDRGCDNLVEVNQIYKAPSIGRQSRRDRHRHASSIVSEPPDLCSLSLTHKKKDSLDSRSDNTVTYNGVPVKLRSRSVGGSSAKAKAVAAIQSRPLPPIPAPPKESQVTLVKTLDFSGFMKNKWISGMAVTKKFELVVVNLREAHIVDEDGNLKKTIGAKDKVRLIEPIGVTVMGNGNIAVSDHADQEVKVYNWKGQYIRKVRRQSLTNIAGVATNDKREIVIAGTDKQCVTILSEDGKTSTSIPTEDSGAKSPFQHPYSIAVNPLTGAIIVGDDYRQLVVAVSKEGRILWRFCPTGDRHFFPSSICVDTDGYVFIADLYNEKVYMLDSGGKFLKTLLSRGEGLKGGPGAIVTDGRGHLFVADEERTVKVFRYGEGGFALYRRHSKVCPEAS